MNRETRRVLFQIALFTATFISTTVAGNEWVYGRSMFFTPDYGWQDFVNGLSFSIPLLLILTVHEFGHYFVAMWHKVKTSLPYYIPIPPIPYLPFSIGTMGAVIRLRSRPKSNLENFDIGLAGPLAGFAVALLIMAYGFITLPSPDYIFQFHPEYKQFGLNYADTVYTKAYMKGQPNLVDVRIGTNGIFWIFGKLFAAPDRVPNPHELMHYPVLLACYIALFVTCLNLLPIGQLDGGHVTYGLFGFRRHRQIATVFYIALMFYAGLGLPYINPKLPPSELILGMALYILFLRMSFRGLALRSHDTWMFAVVMAGIQFLLMTVFPKINGYQGWLFFGFILGRFIGIQHPPSEIEQPLDPKRVLLGWLAVLVFMLCFSPAPIVIE